MASGTFSYNEWAIKSYCIVFSYIVGVTRLSENEHEATEWIMKETVRVLIKMKE